MTNGRSRWQMGSTGAQITPRNEQNLGVPRVGEPPGQGGGGVKVWRDRSMRSARGTQKRVGKSGKEEPMGGSKRGKPRARGK